MFQPVGLEESFKEGKQRRHQRLVAAMATRAVKSHRVIELLHMRGEKTTAATFSGWHTGRVNIDIDTLEYVLETLGFPRNWQVGDPSPTEPLPTWLTLPTETKQ